MVFGSGRSGRADAGDVTDPNDRQQRVGDQVCGGGFDPAVVLASPVASARTVSQCAGPAVMLSSPGPAIWGRLPRRTGTSRPRTAPRVGSHDVLARPVGG